MAKKKSIQDCRSARDFMRVCEAQGGTIKPSSNGVAKVGKPGRGFVSLHQDHGEYRPDQRRYLIKQLTRLGFAVLAIGWAISLF